MSEHGSDISFLDDDQVASGRGQTGQQVIFEMAQDQQYLKGEDIVCYFNVLKGTKINDDDQIGIRRLGCTNVFDCLAFARPEIIGDKDSNSSGQAIFQSNSLPTTDDDEHYQFCYIISTTSNSNKRLVVIGSSVSFKLNYSIDEMMMKPNGSDLISIQDNENDIVILHQEHTLTKEKLGADVKQLLTVNRRLEKENDLLKFKFETHELNTKDLLKKKWKMI